MNPASCHHKPLNVTDELKKQGGYNLHGTQNISRIGLLFKFAGHSAKARWDTVDEDVHRAFVNLTSRIESLSRHVFVIWSKSVECSNTNHRHEEKAQS